MDREKHSQLVARRAALSGQKNPDRHTRGAVKNLTNILDADAGIPTPFATIMWLLKFPIYLIGIVVGVVLSPLIFAYLAIAKIVSIGTDGARLRFTNRPSTAQRVFSWIGVALGAAAMFAISLMFDPALANNETAVTRTIALTIVIAPLVVAAVLTIKSAATALAPR